MNRDKYPRVTTIIAETDDPTKKKALLKWQKTLEKKLGLEGSILARQQILDRGTNIHKKIEDFLNSNKLDEDIIQLGSILKLIKKNAIIAEQRMYSDKWQFQGKPDAIATWDDKLTVIDWTTSEQLKRKQWLEHKFIQAGAYALMCEEYEIYIQQIMVVCLVIGQPKRVQIFTENPLEWTGQFIERLKQFNNLNKIAC